MDTIETHKAETGAHPTVEQKLVPLSLCRYGIDFPGGAINPRKTDRGASEALIASVRQDGIIQPLLGREKDGLFYFSAGDRRLNALFRIHAAARRPESDYPIKFDSVSDVQVPVILKHDGNPLELGLQENLNRNDLHPVDKMEGFAALLAGRPEEGIAPLSVEEIAARFSLRVAQVKTSLRLGALAPAIRDAWRKGTLDAPTAEAFNLCKDEKAQVKLFDRLVEKAGPGGRVTPHMVRQALKAQPGEVTRLLRFVGRDTAAANGIEVSESLFSLAGVSGEGDGWGAPTVHNFAALRVLADEMLANHAELLTKLPNKEGGPWAWAKPASAMPAGWQSWPRMVLDRPLTIKDRASVGCVVSIDSEGRLQVEEAIYQKEELKPASPPPLEEQGPSAREIADTALGAVQETIRKAVETPIGTPPAVAPAAEPVEAESDLSPRLQQQLAEQLTAGLRAALLKRNDLALPLLLAGIAAHGAVIAIDRVDGPPPEATAWPFEEALEKYLAMDQGAQLRALAGVVAGAVLLPMNPGEIPPAFMPGPQALMKAAIGMMGARKLKSHLVEVFDLEGFVKAAPKPALLDAIGEACGAQQRERIAGKGKREVQDFARETLAERKWLPAELGADLLNVGALAGRVGGARKAAAKKRGARPPSAKASGGRR